MFPQRLMLKWHIVRHAAAASPAVFRGHLRIAAERPTPLREVLQPWQARDFAALDAAWLALATGEKPAEKDMGPVRRRAWIERPRGHSKTADMATALAWILVFARRPLAGVAAARDREQARLLHAALQRLAGLNPAWCRGLKFTENRVRNTATGATLDVISGDAPSSYGLLPDFVIRVPS